MMVNFSRMGERISAIRKSKKLTQEKLAEMADITPTNLSHIERGKTKPSVETIVSLANALEVTVNDFLVDSLEFSTREIENVLIGQIEGCTAKELHLITDVTLAILNRLRE